MCFVPPLDVSSVRLNLVLFKEQLRKSACCVVADIEAIRVNHMMN